MINKKIGILGGGQLGKMLCAAGANLSLNLHVLDKSKDYPAGSISPTFVEGNIGSYDDVVAFGSEMDIVTIEFEKINVDALFALVKQGVEVHPSPSIIAMIQDKGIQKQFYQDQGMATSPFQLFKDRAELIAALDSGKVSFPFVQKTRRDGYDGYGVKVCKEGMDKADLFDAPCIIEDLVNIDKELAVIVCRNEDGHMAIYDPVEMIFDPEANLLDYQLAPARISKSLKNDVSDIAYNIADKLGLVGILAIELFLTKDGELLVNEMAPRPHNSGHHSIEACHTSQYENHLRAITNMPLGIPDILSPSILINLLGSGGYTGDTKYGGIEELLRLPSLHVHLYGKELTKPFRKMGHATLLYNNEEIPYQDIEKVKNTFRTNNLQEQ